MVFLLNGKPVDALALIVHRSAEQAVGRRWVKKLRKPKKPGCEFDFSADTVR
jgi:translation elongation factor EF-4